MSLAVLIANHLNCPIAVLHHKLSDPRVRKLVENNLAGRRVFTIYKNRRGDYKEFDFSFLSRFGADRLPAYGTKVKGGTVQEHYKNKHWISLRYPFLPCVVDTFKGQDYYYPLELLQLVPHVLAHAPSGMKSFKKLASRHFLHGHEFRRYKRQVNIYDHHTTKNFFKLNHYRRPPTPMKVRRSPSPPSSETSRAALYSGAHKMEQSRRPLYTYGQGKLQKMPTDFSYLKEELLGWSTPTTPAAPFSPPTTPVKRPPTKSVRTPEPAEELADDMGSLEINEMDIVAHPDSPSYQSDVDMDYEQLLLKGNRRLTFKENNCLITAIEDDGPEIQWLETSPAPGDVQMEDEPLADSPSSPSIVSCYSEEDEGSDDCDCSGMCGCTD
jgi:hypothetical protein